MIAYGLLDRDELKLESRSFDHQIPLQYFLQLSFIRLLILLNVTLAAVFGAKENQDKVGTLI